MSGPEERPAPAAVTVYPLMERCAGVVLLLVMVMLAWVTWAAYQPQWASWLPDEVAVALVVGLLVLALVLVSAVALMQLRENRVR